MNTNVDGFLFAYFILNLHAVIPGGGAHRCEHSSGYLRVFFLPSERDQKREVKKKKPGKLKSVRLGRWNRYWKLVVAWLFRKPRVGHHLYLMPQTRFPHRVVCRNLESVPLNNRETIHSSVLNGCMPLTQLYCNFLVWIPASAPHAQSDRILNFKSQIDVLYLFIPSDFVVSSFYHFFSTPS